MLRPAEDWTYEDFRVFHGAVPTVNERRVRRVTRARDGGSTHVEFELDGAPADAFFPFQGEAKLTVGRDVYQMYVLLLAIDDPVFPSEYRCLLR